MNKIASLFVLVFTFFWTFAVAAIFFTFVINIDGPLQIRMIAYLTIGFMFFIGLSIFITQVINLKKHWRDPPITPTMSQNNDSGEVHRTIIDGTKEPTEMTFSEGTPNQMKPNDNSPAGKLFLVFFTVIWNVISWNGVFMVFTQMPSESLSMAIIPKIMICIFPLVGIFLVFLTIKSFITNKKAPSHNGKIPPIIDNKCPYCGEELEPDSMICMSCFKKVK